MPVSVSDVDHSGGAESSPLHAVGELQLKKPSVRLESCDKIWGTLQLIKNLQGDQSIDDQSSGSNSFRKFVESDTVHSVEPHHGRKKSTSKVQSKPKVSTEGLHTTRDIMPSSPALSNCLQEAESNGIRSSINTASKSKIALTKIYSADERWKCVLCSKLSKDIVNHLKIFHKVASVSAIIQQCQRLTPKTGVALPIEDSSITEESELQAHLIAPEKNAHLKRRKRSTFDWCNSKKRKKHQHSSHSNSNTVINKPFGPYKCDVCFGLYKSQKTFLHHQSLHRRRGQTRENFDSFVCRFKNSPLRTTNIDKSAENSVNHTAIRPKLPKSQTAITNYFERLNKPVSQLNKVEPKSSQGLKSDKDKRNVQERVKCDCGRSFRSYHTLHLHQARCKKPENDAKAENIDDTDSGIGLSIKIKKKENDSYEVLSKAVSSNQSSFHQKVSEDSDASSNDSGMVLMENNRKMSQSKPPGYKCHSIMRIQLAEDDEDVDIEDDSDPGLDENNISIANSIDPYYDSKNFTATNIEIENLEPSKSDSPNALGLRNEVHQTSLPFSSEKSSRDEKCKQGMDTISQSDLQTDTKSELTHDLITAKCSEKNQCLCGKKFTHLKYFNIHVRRLHPQLLKCSYCMTNFDKVETFLDHKCGVVEGKIFIEPIIQTKCLRCDIPLDLGDPFDKHMKTHDLDGPALYQCFKCDKKFDNPHQRQSHFSKEHGVSPCTICGRRLHIDQLVKHEAYHDGLGHPCHLCRKAFTQKSLLKKHLLNIHDHRANEMITCSVCSQSMKFKFLKKHMSFHLHAEVCGKCDKCDRNSELENLKSPDVYDDVHDDL